MDVAAEARVDRVGKGFEGLTEVVKGARGVSELGVGASAVVKRERQEGVARSPVAIVVNNVTDEAVCGKRHVGFVAGFDKDKPMVHEQIVISGERGGHGVEQAQGTVGVDGCYGAYAVDLAVHGPVAPAA